VFGEQWGKEREGDNKLNGGRRERDREIEEREREIKEREQQKEGERQGNSVAPAPTHVMRINKCDLLLVCKFLMQKCQYDGV
jgi:hypothetical protein